MFKTALKNYFSQSTRDKGAELYTAHAIRAFFPTHSGLTMRVIDSRDQRVRFEELSEKIWQADCPCVEFQATSACRHIWAAMLYLDSESSKKPSVKLWLKGLKVESKIVAWFAGVKKAKKHALPRDRAEWEFLVDAMNDSTILKPSHSKKRRVERKLALVLNPRRSRSLDRLVFNLYACAADESRFKKTTVNAVEAKDFPEDRALLEFFLDLEGAHGDPSYPRTSLELNNLIFPRERMKELIEELASGQKMFASLADLHNSKAADFMDKTSATLSYVAEKINDGSLSLEIDLSEYGWKIRFRKDEIQVLCSSFILSGRTIIQIPEIDGKGRHWLNFMEEKLIVPAEHANAFLTKLESIALDKNSAKQPATDVLDSKALTTSTPRYSLKRNRDWLELTLTIDDLEIDLSSISRSIKRGKSIIELSDGRTHHMTPATQRTLERLLGLLQHQGESLVLDTKQLPLLDRMLSSLEAYAPSAVLAEYNESIRKAKNSVDDITPSPRFIGQLRAYQTLGLNWLNNMTKLAFGVCLADEMGLGKTIQILALLDLRHKTDECSLIVMPRSLIGNWKAELLRFVPHLTVLDYSGTKRDSENIDFKNWDLVLTTYGVLLREDAPVVDQSWQHVVLDEAQAIKNPSSLTARAACRLKAKFRIALSGTPLENSSSELVSLFRFLNPGMIGPSTEKSLVEGKPGSEVYLEIARALRPFLLRRRKEDVVLDLPAKLIHTLFCEMSDSQRKVYAEYLIFYKSKIAEQIAKDGFGKSKLLMIEALLRLRQIACHPALVKADPVETESAKLDILMEKLEEIRGSPDKVLIFSQFTSFLSLIKDRLVEQGITHEYLDGQTRDRTERVKRFQEDPEIKVFLISLKSGGVGLNLTAARYAFIMDPWWNPAVEEQAMARAHRIGQEKQVIVYKVVVKDSIEEKILELQQEKSDLVRVFLDSNEGDLDTASILKNLTEQDLSLLIN